MKEKKMGLLKSLFVLFVVGVILLIQVGVILLILLAIWPFWLLFAKMVNLLGVKGIRSTNGKLQTPVVFYEHPITKRIVAFVAAIHIGEPAYYTALQRLIDSLKGYKILFEGTGKLSPQEEQALTEKERSVARQFDFIFSLMRKLAEVMPLQFQKEGLTYASSWVNTDMKLYDLIRSFAQQDICLVKKEEYIDGLFSSESGQATTRWFVNKLFSRFVPVAVIVAGIAFFSRDKRMAKRLILDARNEIAFRGISEHLDDGNIVTIWGAAHLRGIEKRLKQAGFREVRREWFTAYTVRDYSLLDIVKKSVSVAKEATSAATALKKD
ncbi:MAG: hypothetical protein HYS74_02420 [Parcubacteria group bacterium]|nr:hypothetical protein [Parcubacteria group bacterium]